MKNLLNKKTVLILLFILLSLVAIVVWRQITRKDSIPVQQVSVEKEDVVTNSDPNLPTISLPTQSEDSTIGVSRKDNKLVEYSNGEINKIHPLEISSFKVFENNVVLVESTGRDVSIIDLDTKNTVSATLKNLEKIIDIAISPDKNNIYVLGNHDLVSHNSTVFKTNKDFTETFSLISLLANKLDALSNDRLLVVQEGDFFDSTLVRIFDIDKGAVSYTSRVNTFHVSPDKTKVLLLSTTQSRVLDIETLGEIVITIKNTPKTLWLTSNKVVQVSNAQNGFNIEIYDIDRQQVTKSIDIQADSLVREIVGSKDNDTTLVLKNVNGEFLEVDLNQN